MNEVDALFEKADRSFSAAEQLLERDDADFAASRAYYGYFYVAEALLLSKGFSFSRHSQVIAQYGRYFARTEILDRLFRQALSLRQTADYSVEPPPEPEKVYELIEGGEDFLTEARKYIRSDSSQGSS